MKFRTIVFLAVLFFLQSLSAQLPIKRDDFIGTERRLWWQYDLEGPAEPAVQADNVMAFELTEADLNADPWTNTSIWDGHNMYFNCTVTIRARATSPVRPGSRGWGFWYTTPLNEPSQQAWFMEVGDDPAEPNYDPDNVWWRAQVANQFMALDSIQDVDLVEDVEQWQTYKVIRDTAAADEFVFYVNGSEVFRSDGIFIDDPLSVQIWNDNLVYYREPFPGFYNRGWSGGTSDKFVIDYVEVLTAPHPGFNESPSGIKRLREVPMEMGSGATQSLWKNYTVNSTGGKYVVLATARAEGYGSYGDDDDIKLIVDGQDYGYNTANSFDGSSLNGNSKTLVIEKTLTAGAKTVEVHEDKSPLLYDVTVLGSADGDLIINNTYNETAPGGSDFLWKTINFTCEAGEIAIYVSGSADADSTPANTGRSTHHYNNNRDDDLRLVLNGTDFGYQNDNALWGNRLYSEPKSILLVQNLAAGSHTLEIFANRTPTLYNVVIYGENEDAPLPVSLTSFNAFWEGGNAELDWVTQSEVNNLGFNVYRAIDFEGNEHELDFVRVNQELIEGAGNSNQINEYRFRDITAPNDPETILWYRLEQIDFDGTINIHGPIKLQRQQDLISDYRLFQNYPNPFNGETTISFNLAETAEVTLDIYNISGQLVKSLHRGPLTNGLHNFFWDATDGFGHRVSSGVYIYKMSTAKYRVSRKMLLVN